MVDDKPKRKRGRPREDTARHKWIMIRANDEELEKFKQLGPNWFRDQLNKARS